MQISPMHFRPTARTISSIAIYKFPQKYWGFHKWGNPKWMVYNGKSQSKMDDLRIPPFIETSTYSPPFQPPQNFGLARTGSNCPQHVLLRASCDRSWFRPIPVTFTAPRKPGFIGVDSKPWENPPSMGKTMGNTLW